MSTWKAVSEPWKKELFSKVLILQINLLSSKPIKKVGNFDSYFIKTVRKRRYHLHYIILKNSIYLAETTTGQTDRQTGQTHEYIEIINVDY